MLISNESRQKFGEVLAKGLGDLLGRPSSESWLTHTQCLAGHVSVVEALRGGPMAANSFARKVEAISPAITRVQVQPLSLGDPATYSIGISFDPEKVESLYSDGKTDIATLEKDGKKYVVDKDGKATEVEDPDKYVDNLNKTTGSHFQKAEEMEGEGTVEALSKLAEEATLALDGTGVEVKLEDDKLSITGDAALIRPTQEALPDPVFGLDDLEGGYNPETGTVEVVIPKFADTRDIANIEEFLYRAVNIVLDLFEKGDYTPDDAWVRDIEQAEEDPAYASRYAYAGESFVGNDRKKCATLVKTLMSTNFDEAVKVAKVLCGEKVAESIATRRPTAKAKVVESKQPIQLDEETALLDMAHNSVAEACSGRGIESAIDANLA